MSHQLSVIVHDVVKDGLPTDSRFADYDLTGRVAFVFNGHLYSGWPTSYGCWRRTDGEDDVPKGGVDRWVEFPSAIAQLAADGSLNGLVS